MDIRIKIGLEGAIIVSYNRSGGNDRREKERIYTLPSDSGIERSNRLQALLLFSKMRMMYRITASDTYPLRFRL